MKNLGSINDSKSIVTKGYTDSTYAQKSDVASLTTKVGDVSDSLDEVNNKIENDVPKSQAIADYTGVEPPTIDADTLGGKYRSSDIDALKQRIVELESENNELNSNLLKVNVKDYTYEITDSNHGLNQIATIGEVYPASYNTIVTSFVTMTDNYPFDGDCNVYGTIDGRILCHRNTNGAVRVRAIVLYT